MHARTGVDMNTEVYKRLALLRQSNGLLTPDELLALSTNGNVIHDPFSTLISRRASLGTGNTIYPNVIINCGEQGTIVIGNDNLLFPDTLMTASTGTIDIGNANQFGEQGISIRADSPNDRIRIGNSGRYMNGIQLLGECDLGSGSQLLGGPLVIQNCSLEAGGSWQSDDPNTRAGLIKGTGFARGLKVLRGEVVNGRRILTQDQIELQIIHHPPPATTDNT